MSARHVLFARMDNVGDVLLTGPAVRAVAGQAARVTYLTSTTGAPAARLLPGVDDVVTFDAPWVSLTPPPVDRRVFDDAVDRLGSLGVDHAIIATSFHQSPLPLALMLRLAGVGFVAATSVDFPGSLVDLRHDVIDGHEVEQSLSLVAAAGYELPPGDPADLRVRRPLPKCAPFQEPYVVVHPGSSVPARAISPAVARAAVCRLVESGLCVAVTGSAAEAALVAEVASGGHDAGADHRVSALAGVHDLAALAGVLADAECAVVGNTGPAHLAAAVATPVVSVFAPVVPNGRWRPWGVPTVTLGDQTVECAGCRARTCPLSRQRCLDPVTPDAIAAAALSFVGPTARPMEAVAT